MTEESEAFLPPTSGEPELHKSLILYSIDEGGAELRAWSLELTNISKFPFDFSRGVTETPGNLPIGGAH